MGLIKTEMLAGVTEKRGGMRYIVPTPPFSVFGLFPPCTPTDITGGKKGPIFDPKKISRKIKKMENRWTL